MSRNTKEEKCADKAGCPVRATVRWMMRYSLLKDGYQELADNLFDRSAVEDCNVIARYPAIVALKSGLVRVQEERSEQFLDLVVGLRSYQGTPDEAFELYKCIAERLLSRQANMGRLGALMAFSGFTAAELATKGAEFLRPVASKIVDEVGERVNAFLKTSGKDKDFLVRASGGVSSDFKIFNWTKPLQTLGGVAAMVGSAFVLATVLAKS